MDTEKKRSIVLRVAILLIVLATLPFVIPETVNSITKPAVHKSEQKVAHEISILTNTEGRSELIQRIKPFRLQHPEIGIRLILDTRALGNKTPDLSTLATYQSNFIARGGLYVNPGSLNYSHVQAFLKQTTPPKNQAL